MEPLDLFEQHVEPCFRERAVKIAIDPVTHRRAMVVDGKPMRLRDVEEVLAILSGYGQKEQGGTTNTFDRYSVYSDEWQDMTARIHFLDAEGFATQIIYPTLGIVWEGELSDPVLAAALCRAYNRWAFDLVEGHRQRLFPAAHISIREPALAVEELRRVAKLGCRIAFIAAMPVNGRSFGHPTMTLCGRQPRTSIFRSGCMWSRTTTTWAASFIESQSQG
jgi:predicted TIM-barrel fold metal-dependent hydrolase